MSSSQSNYPSVVKLDPKAGRVTLVSSFEKNPSLALHAAVISARTGAPLSEEVKEAAEAVSSRYTDIPKEAIWEQWDYLIRSPQPSAGLQAIYEMGWEKNFPELAAIRGVPQAPSWHPEGPVEIHTAQAADVAARNAARDNLSDDETRVAVMGAICHDLGKSNATFIENGRVVSPTHPQTGTPLAKSFLKSIGASEAVQREVPLIVLNHMCHATTVSSRAVRRLIARLDNNGNGTTLEAWSRVTEADVGGRGSASSSGVSKPWLEYKHKMDNVKAATPKIIDGRMLMGLNVEDRRSYGQIIKDAYTAQLEGTISDEESAQKWLSKNNYI
ncbi:MAG: hypothetical protein H9W81_17250 [Enterococcus sp.]|nr:hypothetical protein [Enterococcus sp.]